MLAAPNESLHGPGLRAPRRCSGEVDNGFDDTSCLVLAKDGLGRPSHHESRRSANSGDEPWIRHHSTWPRTSRSRRFPKVRMSRLGKKWRPAVFARGEFAEAASAENSAEASRCRPVRTKSNRGDALPSLSMEPSETRMPSPQGIRASLEARPHTDMDSRRLS